MSGLTDDVVALGRLQTRYADVISRRAFPELIDLFRPDAVVTIDTVTRPERRIVGPDGPRRLHRGRHRALRPLHVRDPQRDRRR